MKFANQRWFCIALLSLGYSVTGCTNALESEQVVSDLAGEVIDGGTVVNADRDQAQQYLTALSGVQSAEEEVKLVTEFADWLNEHEYKIVIEEKEGKHVLSCPYFPPVTPWASHAFLDIKNLALLPN